MQTSGHETGTVLNVDGEWATVITNKSASCGECGKAEAGICGKSGDGMVMRVLNPLNAVKGDTIELGLRKNIVVTGYFFFFVLPVLALFIGVYAGDLLSRYLEVKGMDITAGLTGLVLSVLYSIRKLRILDRSARLSITNIISDLPAGYISMSSEEMDYLRAFNGNAR